MIMVDIPDGTKTLLVKGTLRSGQRVMYEGNLVILGDVNPGAEVVASGDILVLGTLRGMAHAGATGDSRAVVAALHLEPTQLRIANHISRPPAGERQTRLRGAGRPELALVVGDTVVVDRRRMPAGLVQEPGE